MNMIYFSIYLYHLWLLSSVLYSFQFSIYRSFVSLGRFIPNYFIIFIAMVNGIVSLISLSVFSLLVYKNARDFCVLILYPATILHSLISNFLVVALGFSMYRIMSSENSESFTSSFPIWILFIPFSSLISVTKRSKTMLNSSGESGRPCLVPDFRGNAFSFSPLRIMFAVGLSHRALFILRYVPSIPVFWRVLIINGCWILSKAFSASIEIIIWFLSFNLLMWCITLIDLRILKNPCIPGIKGSHYFYRSYFIKSYYKMMAIVPCAVQYVELQFFMYILLYEFFLKICINLYKYIVKII